MRLSSKAAVVLSIIVSASMISGCGSNTKKPTVQMATPIVTETAINTTAVSAKYGASGYVVDSSNAAIEGAYVIFINADGKSFADITDSNGIYNIICPDDVYKLYLAVNDVFVYRADEYLSNTDPSYDYIVVDSTAELTGYTETSDILTEIQTEPVVTTQAELTAAATTELTEAAATEAVTHYEPWVQAYYDFMYNELYMQYMTYYSSDSVRFTTAYIDDDDIPEILMAYDNSHSAQVYIFTYCDTNEFEPVSLGLDNINGGQGSFGSIYIQERKNRVYSCSVYSGNIYNEIFYIGYGGLAYTTMKAWALQLSAAEYEYHVYYGENGIPVSNPCDESTYTNACAEYAIDGDLSAWTWIGYENMLPVTNSNIESELVG